MELEETTKRKFKSNQKKYQEELTKLENKYSGRLSPPDIVREASKNSSPLHNWFDWSDDSASDKWRLHQARLLLNIIKVKVNFEGSQKVYRKYLNVNVTTDGKTERFYMPTVKILKNEDLKSQILRRAINEAEYWKRTYEDYQELEDIFKGIIKTKKRLKKILVVNNAR